MLQFEELKQELSGLEPSIRDLEGGAGVESDAKRGGRAGYEGIRAQFLG